VLFLGLVVHLFLFLAASLFNGRVQDFLLQRGMDSDFLLDAFQQFGTLFHRALRCRRQLFEQFLDQLVVLGQQFDGVHGSPLQVVVITVAMG